jgi:hypothetical protein
MDRAAMNGQRNLVQRLYAREGFADFCHLQQNILIHVISSLTSFFHITQYGTVNTDGLQSVLTVTYRRNMGNGQLPPKATAARI